MIHHYAAIGFFVMALIFSGLALYVATYTRHESSGVIALATTALFFMFISHVSDIKHQNVQILDKLELIKCEKIARN